jgi:hypothetical protein
VQFTAKVHLLPTFRMSGTIPLLPLYVFMTWKRNFTFILLYKNLVKLCIGNNGKGKVRPRTDHEDPGEEYWYSSTLSLTSALDGGAWSTPLPGQFTSRERPGTRFKRLGGPQGRSGRVRKISAPPGFDRRTAQPVASRHTD